jgi:hypothetical protein
MQKKGIALLITVYFIMVITVAIGVGLRYINDSKNSLNSEHFLLQSSVVVNDVVNILKKSKEVASISSSDKLYTFLSISSAIPLKVGNLDVFVSLKSARGKLSANLLKESSNMESFKTLLHSNMISEEYAYMLLDSVSGIKEDLSYNTDIFNDNPYMFRDYIASQKHLKKIETIFKNRYRDNAIENINFEELFYPSHQDTKIDLNYASPLVWQFLIRCDALRAEALSQNGGLYTSIDDIGLSDDEKVLLERFEVSFFEPYIDVSIEIKDDKHSGYINFEYNIESKKGSNFVYEI